VVDQRRVTRSGARTDWSADVTEIIAFREFGALQDATSEHGNPFAVDEQILSAPELDDLNDLADETPRLLLPSRDPLADIRLGPPRSAKRALAPDRPRPFSPATSTRTGGASPGAHRRPAEATGAVHSRLITAAIAAGGIAAASYAALNPAQTQADPVLIADAASTQVYAPDASGMQVVSVASTFDSAVHRQELANGTAFAQERAQREARLRRPQFVFPARGVLTSGYGTRWGTLHAGLDIANAIGTPIYAASDGEVIASGPTPGYGMWVKIRATDGTVTLYGHIDTATVRAGERVMAGDQIATMGNRGNSTGPHLHFEVHRNGTDKTDPMAWLQDRGVSDG